MPVKMFKARNDPFAFLHARAGSQRNGIPLLPCSNRGMRFMGVAPGRASVNECFELARNICPIGGGYADNDISQIELLQNNGDVIIQVAFRGKMAGPASPAETESIVIDADAFYSHFLSQLF